MMKRKFNLQIQADFTFHPLLGTSSFPKIRKICPDVDNRRPPQFEIECSYLLMYKWSKIAWLRRVFER